MEYDMVWCGTMQLKQHKTIELQKKKKMRTEQDKPEQSRTKQNRKGRKQSIT